MGLQSIRIVGASVCYLHFAPENPEDGDTMIRHLGVTPWKPPHAYANGAGRNAAQPCARTQGYVNDDLRADGLWRSWDFDSLTGRAGEVLEAPYLGLSRWNHC